MMFKMNCSDEINLFLFLRFELLLSVILYSCMLKGAENNMADLPNRHINHYFIVVFAIYAYV